MAGRCGAPAVSDFARARLIRILRTDVPAGTSTFAPQLFCDSKGSTVQCRHRYVAVAPVGAHQPPPSQQRRLGGACSAGGVCRSAGASLCAQCRARHVRHGCLHRARTCPVDTFVVGDGVRCGGRGGVRFLPVPRAQPLRRDADSTSAVLQTPGVCMCGSSPHCEPS